MHDPLVVAHEIIRPWPQRSGLPASDIPGERWRVRLHHVHRDDCAAEGCTGNPFPWWRLRSYSRFWRLAGRDWYWPSLITVWHREPGGRDSGDVCPHYRRWQDADGKWQHKTIRRWRWHVWHWKIQVPPLQGLRRRLLTRCAWCGGRDRKGDRVNISHSWDGPRGRWWHGEPGLFHVDCSSVERAHALCFCPDPVLRHGDYGRCELCGGSRAWHQEPDEADRLLAALPHGGRITPDMRPAVEAAWAQRRARKAAHDG